MKFIDLFAGLGGFHKALKSLGHTCVYASEIDPVLKNLYENNWGIRPSGNIKDVIKKNINEIPEHDILCAGFPCQPFSKAGKQEGMRDNNRGTLFDDIIKILKYRKPKYFILENVPFITKHDNEETWKYMERKLRGLGYDVDHRNYSPHEFGIPQHRIRIFIVGSLDKLDGFDFDDIDASKTKLFDINLYIKKKPKVWRQLPKSNQVCIELWQKFINAIPRKSKIPGFPIWAMEFGATYPFEGKIPYRLKAEELGKYKGNFGKSLKGLSKAEQFVNLPSYARVTRKFPDWKKSYIKQNRAFYKKNKKYIEKIIDKIAKYPSQSWQKLEWNVGDNERKITNYILQFRPSGIRIKNVDFFPSLVCTNTQIPIIGWQKRYLTRDEGQKLQSLEGIKLPNTDNAAFIALGNAVNAKIVKLIAKKLIHNKSLPNSSSINLAS